MGHDLAFRTALRRGWDSLRRLGIWLGGILSFTRSGRGNFLQYFLALGAGYMLAVAFVEVIPASVRLSGESALLYVLIGYFLVHLFEHTLAPHFHFGEETHLEEMSHHHARTSVLVGLTIPHFFRWRGNRGGIPSVDVAGGVMFFAVFLHKLPEGFTVASVVLASGRASATRFWRRVYWEWRRLRECC